MTPLLSLWLTSACGWGSLSNDALEPQIGQCFEGEGLLYPLEEGAWWRHNTEDTAQQQLCKLVWVEELARIDLRPDVTAYKVHSLRVTEAGVLGYGVRWQEVRDCGLVRHVDEWFDPDMTTLEALEYYCPYRIRVDDCSQACDGGSWDVDDCDRVCEGATWTEEEDEVTTLELHAGGEGCDPRTVEVDHDTCQLLQSTDCAWSLSTGKTDWRIKAAHEEVSIALGTFDTLHTQQRRYDDFGDPQGWHSYWRARGVGKIYEVEEDGTEEELIRYCLPKDGCTEPPPTVEELIAECAALQ